MAITVSQPIKNSNVGQPAVQFEDVGSTTPGSENLEERLDDLEGVASASILETTGPRNRKFMLGAGSDNFQPNGDRDTSHFDEIFTLTMRGERNGTTLTGNFLWNKQVTGVGFPTNYYMRTQGNTIVPTTDGTNQATSDLRDYVGESRDIFYGFSGTVNLQSDGSKQHQINSQNDNTLLITTTHLNSDLLVVFDFSDFDVDVSSFTADLVVDRNEGDKNSLYSGKDKLRFNRVATNRYSMTLGTGSTFDTANIKVKDVFNKQIHQIDLDSGSHPNQVDVTGHVIFDIPFIPNGHQVMEASFSVPVVVP